MYVFAHLSDPHLSPVPIPYPWQMFNKRFTSYLAWQFRNRRIHQPARLAALLADLRSFAPNHVVVTGDVTNIALPGEFMAARRWLEGLGSARDVTVIPGNHDACVSTTWRHSYAHWAEFMSGGGSKGNYESIPSSLSDFPFIRRRGPIALVGLNSAVPMPVTGTPAAGRLGREQVTRLKDGLARLGREGLFRVVLIHHAPHVGLPVRKALLDQQEFAAAIREAGAELVLHGHLHQSDFGELDGPHGKIPMIGVPSASAKPFRDKPPARYHVHRLSGAAGAWHLDTEVREVSPLTLKVASQGRFTLVYAQGSLVSAPLRQEARGAEAMAI